MMPGLAVFCSVTLQGKSEAEVEKFAKFFSEAQKVVDSKQLRPMIRTQYMRTAFQIPFDSSVRMSLDTNLVMIKENPADGPTCHVAGRCVLLCRTVPLSAGFQLKSLGSFKPLLSCSELHRKTACCCIASLRSHLYCCVIQVVSGPKASGAPHGDYTVPSCCSGGQAVAAPGGGGSCLDQGISLSHAIPLQSGI